ncbi:MAG: arylsulfotransferase family protein [Planctomycetes bacterium]|nr:arylsulfotransferase family protein [Planctomycetota bacterium]
MRRTLLFALPLLTLAVGTVYGGWAYHNLRFPFDGSFDSLRSAAMRQTEARFRRPGQPKSNATQVQNLAEMGYADGSELAEADSGVVRHDAKRSWQGLNLYTSGHAELAVLMDMDGKEIHRWEYNLAAELPEEAARQLRARFRRAQLAPNGELTVVYGGHSWLARFDKDSNLIWKHENGFHHDFEIQEDGKIYAIASERQVLERIHPERPIIEDFIVVLSETGEELARQSVLEAFENSDYAPMLSLMPAFGDILHTNTIEVLSEPSTLAPKSWKAGQVMVSMREMDTIAVIDLSEQRVVWAKTGLWDAQHQPTVLENGHLLIFDNYGTGMSRIMEFVPAGMDLVWDFSSSENNGFYSETCGSQHRLPNGNTLITESDSGRAFEVTPGGNEVWRFLSPHRAPSNADLVATLFEVVRYPLDYLNTDAFTSAD